MAMSPLTLQHSSVNYKDGLAVTGKGPIIRRFPLIPGIDFAGTVKSRPTLTGKPGDKVVLGGWGVGEGHHGGFAEMARVNGDWLVPLPEGFTTADAMAIGVAGYTAMLCVMALEEQGVMPDTGRNSGDGSGGRRRFRGDCHSVQTRLHGCCGQRAARRKRPS